MSKDAQNRKTIGILAYGSLISDPRIEIETHHTEVIKDVMTPFHVEFARSSSGRGGAPTLVPVSNGGTKVKGQVFVMNLSEEEATHVLYRREIGRQGQTDRLYKRPKVVTEKNILVERLTDFAGLDFVLYTKIAATITPLTAERLADLAIASVAKAISGLDGITYLKAAKESGIVTALSPSYETEILRKTDCETLEQALAKLQSQ